MSTSAQVTFEGAAGDYNVLLDGRHLGRVRRESKRLAGQRKVYGWVAYAADVSPLGRRLGKFETRAAAADALVEDVAA